MKKLILFSLCFCFIAAYAQPDGESAKMTYVLDNIPIAKTPKYLGLNVEVMKYADKSNIWDWLTYSNAKMVRAPHPPRVLRKNTTEAPTVNDVFKTIKTQKEFDQFREKIKENPENNIKWENYLFDTELPWLGRLDDIFRKLSVCQIEPILAMAYAPVVYPEPVINGTVGEIPVSDDKINWGAAASAYDYYFACIYHYAKNYGTTHFMMRNEPNPDDLEWQQAFGVFSRLARMAMDDVKTLVSKDVAAKMQLNSVASYLGYEEYLKYYKDYVDILDVHFYDTDGELIQNKMRRALMRARQNNLKVSLTEFGRIGGGTEIDESLFGMNASFQVADLIMNVLSVRGVNDPDFEEALFYQLQFPATHRNYKSLVYGDMNLVDWTGQDLQLRSLLPDGPDFQSLQLRFPTPSYSIYNMLARMSPGNEGDSYNVFELMEANRGVSATAHKDTKRNVWPALGEERYYAMGGNPYKIKTLAIETSDCLYINFLNQEPAPLKDVSIDVSSMGKKYSTAVVRETSLLKRDEPIQQSKVVNDLVNISIPAESFIQVIFVKEDLSAIKEIKVVEKTFTRGSLKQLGLLETTLLQVLGKVENRWLNLSDLNATFKVGKNSGLKVYNAGLLQCIGGTNQTQEIEIGLLDNNNMHTTVKCETNGK